MGLFEDITVYLWNWFVFAFTCGQIAVCWFVGGWGLLWDNDFGYASNVCYRIAGPRGVSYPVEYMSPFWENDTSMMEMTGKEWDQTAEAQLGWWCTYQKQHNSDLAKRLMIRTENIKEYKAILYKKVKGKL